MKAYECLGALAAILLVLGGFALLSHLSGQMRVGHASVESLITGVACLSAGVVLLILSDFGRRLIRIERSLTAGNRQAARDDEEVLLD